MMTMPSTTRAATVTGWTEDPDGSSTFWICSTLCRIKGMMAGPASSVTLGVGEVDGGLVVGLAVGLGVGAGVGLVVGDAVGDLVGGFDTGLLVGLGVDLCAEMGEGLAFD